MNNSKDAMVMAEKLIVTHTGNPLKFIHKVILQETLSPSKITYAQIAQKSNYSEGYIKNFAAPQLWQILSEILNTKVTKQNCRILLEQKLTDRFSSHSCHPARISEPFALEFPEGHLSVDSPFYIERADLESTCYQEITKPGAFLRLKAPQKMGKTSLATRIIAYGTARDFPALYLTLGSIETEIFSSVTKFLRWFCANVTQKLGLEPKLDDYWDEDLGALMSCTIYFQEYLLKTSSHPLLLVLDEVDRVFEHPHIAQDFLTLLRFWYEKTRDRTLWQKLRLVIINSTDIYLALKTNQSPFNVGLTIELPPFSNIEIDELAKRHQIKLNEFELERLGEITGGLPYLVRLALYESSKQNIALKTLLEDAIIQTAIFNRQLHYLLKHLQQYPDLWSGFQQILQQSSTNLPTEISFNLASLGLVKLENNEVKASCELYQKYFCQDTLVPN